MSIENLIVMYEAVNTNASFEEFAFFVGDETDVQTILSWFKNTTVH